MTGCSWLMLVTHFGKYMRYELSSSRFIPIVVSIDLTEAEFILQVSVKICKSRMNLRLPPFRLCNFSLLSPICQYLFSKVEVFFKLRGIQIFNCFVKFKKQNQTWLAPIQTREVYSIADKSGGFFLVIRNKLSKLHGMPIF